MSNTFRYWRYIFLCLVCLLGCENRQKTLFKLISPQVSGISFTNTIIETEKLNVMQYEYMYNGGGVGVGDFNNDGLPDIYFTGNMVDNKLYLNKGGFKFEDVTEISGVKGKSGWKTGVSIADVNGDGLLDIYVCYSGIGTAANRSNQLFINKGNDRNSVPKFEDEADQYGIDAKGSFSTQAVFLDYDLDGDLDVFLLNHSKTFYSPFVNTKKLRNTRHPFFGNALYRNDDNKFTDVSEVAGIYGGGLNFGLGVAISDFNQDGFPDIYVSNDYDEQDFLYLNNSDGTFTDSSKKSFGHISKYSMGADVSDINNDGLADLVTLDMLPEDNYRQKLLQGPDKYDRYQVALDSGYHKQQMRNMLQLNYGIDKDAFPIFGEIGQLAGISNTDWSWSVLMADYDNNGLKDMFITNGYLRDYTNLDFLKFDTQEAISEARAKGVELLGEKGKKEFADIIYKLVKKMPSTKIPNYMFENRGNFEFKNVTEPWGFSNPTVSTGAAYADLDGDGYLDLIVNNTNETAGIYKNRAKKAKKNNFLKIRLKGKGKNAFAIGAKVWVYSDSVAQYLENYAVRGYQSTVDQVLHFGLGKSKKADVKVLWPDGGVTISKDVAINEQIQFDQDQAKSLKAKKEYGNVESAPQTIFKDVTEQSGLPFTHHEDKFVDFRVDRLALKQSSRLGPKLSVADVNNDGLKDFFVGGASGQCDKLFLAKKDGTFIVMDQQCWKKDKTIETIGSVFFDADGDGDKDIYIVSGGGQLSLGAPLLQDRLFVNDGKGGFNPATEGALPAAFSNGSCAVAGDYDNDGDEDLFVGGSNLPGSYPLSAPGGILRNDTEKATGKIKFTLATDTVNSLLKQPGLATGAIWTYLNDDEWLDLVVVGEWMPIRVFLNKEGRLTEMTSEFGLDKSNGLWQCVTSADMDGDGDKDLIVGNMGLNMPFKVTENEPLEVHSDDFSGNGSINSIISSYIQGKRYPIASMEELQGEIPSIKKKFLKHSQYSSATMETIFSKDQLDKSERKSVYMLQSLYLENKGGRFEIHSLPVEAQFSPIQGIVARDFTGDGSMDMLMAGNYFPFRVQYGPIDAGRGLLLEVKGPGDYVVVENRELGMSIRGDVRDLKALENGTELFLIVSKNDDSLQVIQATNSY